MSGMAKVFSDSRLPKVIEIVRFFENISEEHGRFTITIIVDTDCTLLESMLRLSDILTKNKVEISRKLATPEVSRKKTVRFLRKC
jgi:hypothetical protein